MIKRLKRKSLWLTIPLVFSLFMLGFRRDWFFDTVDQLFFQLFSPATDIPITKYPSSFSGILQGMQASSKWFASLLYTFLFSLHAAALVFCIYRSKKLVGYTFLTYLVLALLCFVLILLGNALHSYTLGYGLAQHLKQLTQSPFLIGLLLVAFHFLEMAPRSK
jgi:hypothetical protein